MTPEELQVAGFNDDEILEYGTLNKAGFSDQEIDDYYAGKSPKINSLVQNVLDAGRIIAGGIVGLGTVPHKMAERERQLAEKQGITDAPAHVLAARKGAELLARGAERAQEFLAPQTSAGENVAGVLSKPFEKLGELGASVSEKATQSGLPIPVALQMGGMAEFAPPMALPQTIRVAKKIPIKMAGIIPSTKGRKATQFIKKLGGKLPVEKAGEIGLKGAIEQERKVVSAGESLYEARNKLVPEGSKISMEKTYGIIDDILNDPSWSDAAKKVALDARNEISPPIQTGGRGRGRFSVSEQDMRHLKDAPPEKWVGEPAGITTPIDFREAWALNKKLGQMTRRADRETKKVIHKITDSIKEETAEYAETIGVPELTKAQQSATDYWRDTVVPQRATTEMLEKTSIEKIPRLISSDIETVTKVKNAMPEDVYQDVKRGYATQIFEQGKNNPHEIAKIVRNLNSRKRAVFEKALGQEEFELMRRLGNPGKTKEWLERHPRTKWIVGMAAGSVAYYEMREALKSGGR